MSGNLNLLSMSSVLSSFNSKTYVSQHYALTNSLQNKNKIKSLLQIWPEFVEFVRYVLWYNIQNIYNLIFFVILLCWDFHMFLRLSSLRLGVLLCKIKIKERNYFFYRFSQIFLKRCNCSFRQSLTRPPVHGDANPCFNWFLL